jgi:hypothetical protein
VVKVSGFYAMTKARRHRFMITAEDGSRTEKLFVISTTAMDELR